MAIHHEGLIWFIILCAALNNIPEDYRAVVLLADVEEFSYKEVAATLDIPMGTVMSRLSRARRMLREQLTTVADSYGIRKKTSGEASWQ